MSERTRAVAKTLFGIEFPPFVRIPATEDDQHFNAVVARLIEANRPVYEQLTEDMRNFGACYLKSNADGSVERIAPELVREA